MFQVREGEEREIDPTEEYKVPGIHHLSQLDNWVHAQPSILKNGRLGLLLPPDMDPEKDAEKEMKLLEASDPNEIRLKQLSFDRGTLLKNNHFIKLTRRLPGKLD